MTPIRAVVHDLRIEFTVPDDIPDGTEVLVDLLPLSMNKIGLSEAEWRDDAEALADWEKWLESVEPVEFAANDAFTEQFRQFNVEAVRKQLRDGAITRS